MNLQVLGIYFTAFCLIVGAIFAVVSAIGLLKFNDSMTRMHAPTKVGTVGIGALLLASIIHSKVLGEGSLHELLIIGFLFVTAPISAKLISKVNIHTRSCEMPPPPQRDEMWSTLNVPEVDQEFEDPKPTDPATSV